LHSRKITAVGGWVLAINRKKRQASGGKAKREKTRTKKHRGGQNRSKNKGKKE